MDNEAIRSLLEAVASGESSVTEAARRLTDGVFADGPGYAELGFAKVDTHRPLRTGEPEVVYGAGKTVDQVLSITARLRQAHPEHPILVTRASDETRAALRSTSEPVTEDPLAAIVAIGALPTPNLGTVAVLCAGTSDLPVATEAAFTARAFGLSVVEISDVGVAGLHRLLAARETLATADCVIVVAGMDGALPSAVGGLVAVPLIAVPTSVGYGAAFGGLAPLLTMLNSCAPGVSVVNIDNGFGAAVCAARIVRTKGALT
ncbi:nickel pincer cofactor biosynthesis protein LarB [Stackebrandtia nassauensis]|uniref:1-(5-phosphoribosyl)-5-amino-4-imidazole-carboxylate (AIR) carboxylase n=1 Tax=Stackebrandtia nassauensis (strain DSM 44728 / CIP 108903 / NRRL B-16338 / NBRC 102104 / LLR-40K-21) TaxID=446470 RepID=D3Q5L7_STANL|nr:nickel pincer cofactor biosynthesis protein LarB [Stackebrandtia nassauensis]ADD46077.1 1-(5-phosphoribosyl)-5-amino-4-imidazole- carboxylate (AIR) carboxylase [Stackebrandtia nassauensis DSM 44728]